MKSGGLSDNLGKMIFKLYILLQYMLGYNYWMEEGIELSDREIEIIRLVATGASNKEIAHELTISPNTVKVHLRNIFGKLGVLSRTEATMTAIKMGLVEAPGQFNNAVPQSSVENMTSSSVQESAQTGENKRINLFRISVGLIILVLVGFLIYRSFSPTSPPEGAVSAEEFEQMSSNRWTAIQNLPANLSAMGFIRYENQFIIVGGENETGVLSDVWSYDTNNDEWNKRNPIPKPVKEIQAAILGERIFVPGGSGEDNSPISDLYIYNPRLDTWEPGSSLPIGISSYGLVSYEGKLYLFGGFDGESYLDSIYVYNPDVDDWNLYAKMPFPCAKLTAVVLGGRIHIMGGVNDEGVLDIHQVYIPQREEIGEPAWLDAASLPSPRYNMNSNVLAEMIYVAGGKNEVGESLPVIQYLPPKDSWVEIDNPAIEIGDLPAVIPFETRLFVMGGLTENGYSNQSLAYQAVYTILVPVVR